MTDTKPERLDLLLLHVPKFNNFYDPIGHFVLGNLLPMGIFALADAADRSGFRTRIYHLGVEVLFGKGFRLDALLQAARPRLVGLDLHWHYQTHDVLEVAARVKALCAETPIVLGGYTASLYADQILAERPAVDFVIRGDAERPLVGLLDALRGGGAVDAVPNLSFRRHGRPQHNPVQYVATGRDLDRMDFARFDLLEHARTYFEQARSIVWLRSFPRRFNFIFFTPGRMGGYMVPVSRGCPVDCANCGGSRSTLRAIDGRQEVAVRSVAALADELDRVRRFGIEDLYFAQDPFPDADFYPRLFRDIRRRGLAFRAAFETFRLPSPEFVEEFRGTFGEGNGKGTYMLISPETGSEAHRRRNRGYGYANAELFAALDRLEAAKIPFQVSYTLGLPGETIHTLEETRRLSQAIRARYRLLVTQAATIIDADPGSPMEREAAACGITCRPRTLEELALLHRESYRKSHTGWGYLPIHHECQTLPLNGLASRTLCATDVYLRRYKCRHFCNYFGRLAVPYPLNRAICRTAGLLFKLHSRLLGFPRIRI